MYTDDDRRIAREKQLNLLEELKVNGGVKLFDVCNEAYRNVPGSSFLKVATEENMGYESFFQYQHLEALWQNHNGVISVILVHNPLCDIFQSLSEGRIPSWKVESQSSKAMMAHLVQAIIRKMKNPMKNSSIKTNQSIWGNFLVAYAMRVYLLQNLHVHSMTATIFGKNMLWTFGNVFSEECHGLSASKHGKTKRQQSKSRRGATLINRDRGIRSSLLHCLSKVRVPSKKEDFIKGVVDLIHHQRANNKPRNYWNQLRLLCRFRESHLKDSSLIEDIKTTLTEKHHTEVDERRKDRLDITWWKHYNELVEYMEKKEGWDGIFFVEMREAASGLYTWWRKQVGFDPNWKYDKEPWKKEELRLLGVSFDTEKIEKAISSKGDHTIAEGAKDEESEEEDMRRLNDLFS